MRIAQLFLALTAAAWSNGARISEAQTDDATEWRLAIDFLMALDKQRPIGRLVAFFQENRQDELRVRIPLANLRRACSERGIFMGAAKIPSPQALSHLRPGQPPVLCALVLTSPAATVAFLRAASEGEYGDNFSWVYFTRTKVPDLSFLRADAKLMLVLLDAAKAEAKITRWSGVGLERNFSTWKTSDKIINPGILAEPRFSLHGQILSVATFHDPPFVILSEETKAQSGWMVELWAELQKSLNFTSSFYVPPRATGGHFKRAVEELAAGRADVVLAPFAAIHGDTKQADLTLPFTTFHYKFVVPRISATSSVRQFLLPFSTGVWQAIVAISTLAVVLMTTAYMVGQQSGFELPGRPLYGFSESLLVLFGSLLAQGPDFSPASLSARIILWCTYVFGFVIAQAYAATLIANLLLGVLEPPFRNSEGMLSSQYTPILVLGSAPHRLTKEATEGFWSNLKTRRPAPKSFPDLDAALLEVSNAWSFTTLIEAQERLVPIFKSPNYICKLMLVPSEVVKIPAGLMLPKSSPLKKALDRQLLVMASSGRLSRLRAKWIGTEMPGDFCGSLRGQQPYFEMENVALPFYILLGGFSIGLLLLFAEFLIQKWLSDELRPLELLRQIAASTTRRMQRN